MDNAPHSDPDPRSPEIDKSVTPDDRPASKDFPVAAPDGASPAGGPSGEPPSPARQWLNVVLVVVTGALVFLGPRPSEDRERASPPTLPATAQPKPQRSELYGRLKTLEQMAERFDRAGLPGLRAEIADRPIEFLALTALGLLGLAILAVGFVGLILGAWFLSRLSKRRPIMDQAPAIEAKWTVLDALGAVALFFLVATVLAGLGRASSSWVVFAWMFAFVVACLYGRYVVESRCRQSLAAAGVTRAAFGGNVGRGIVAYITALPLFAAAMYASMYLVRTLFDVQPARGQSPLEALLTVNSPGVLAMYVITITLIGPLAEEFLFRGLLYGAIRRWLSAKWTILVTAAVFALVHRSPIIMPPIFVLGLFLAYLYEKRRSLVATATMHVLQNTVAVTVVLLIRLAT